MSTLPLEHGFELLREVVIPELNTTARLYRHVRTGAQLLSLINDDENKAFGITFRTPPNDSTGIAHILEHSVLCGSRKYPVKEPFIELVKGSLNTFLNAFTFGDKTVYPLASTNLQDFYNLIDVYLDSVFYPRMTEHTLQQEGWHYELEAADAEMIFKGVVYNEMKGAYSSPDGRLGRLVESSLLPDTIYGVDSGGDPREIPNLTWETFKRFHETYYHPSNSLIYFYGDDDPTERLRLLDRWLSDFERLDVQARIELQPRFDAPRRVTYFFQPGDDPAEQDKAQVTVTWLLNERIDNATTMAMDALAYILVGTAASPLRKALIDSGLGDDLTGSGISHEQRQIYFSTGLKGVRVDNAEQVEALVVETLQTLERDGIEPEQIEAALNTIEFRLRENNTGSFPRGLSLMLRALQTWLYDGDPVAAMAFEAPLNALKARLAADPRTFETLIREHLLDNPHRVTLLFQPDLQLREREDAAERDRLAQARSAMSDSEVERLVEDTLTLRRLQEMPDSPEALATIPSLHLGDIPREAKQIPIAVYEANGGEIIYHDLFTNGIAYLDVGFNLHVLPSEYLPYLPLFVRSLVQLGTQSQDFVRLIQRIGRRTGGVGTSTLIAPTYTSAESTAWLLVRGKGTMRQIDDVLAIMRDILLTVNFDNPSRFRQLVLEDKADAEARLVPAGHTIANARIKAHFHEADWANEQMGGVTQLFFLRDLLDRVDNDWAGVLAVLQSMYRLLVNRHGMFVNITLDSANYAAVEPRLRAFIDSLPGTDVTRAVWTRTASPVNEGLVIPSQVNFVGKGTNLYQHGYTYDGSLMAITNLLRTGYLWEKIRMQGGAYGAFCTFDARTGTFTFLSYRDPNLTATLDNYDAAADFLRGLTLDERGLTRTIIGAISDLDAYQLPDAKGFTSLVWRLTGNTDERRQRVREQLLETSSADFRAFADALDQVKANGVVVVVGTPTHIEATNALRGGDFLRVRKLL